MTEKNSYDKTIEYAIGKGLDYDSHKSGRRFYITPNDPIVKTKHVIFKVKNLFFVAYDSYATRLSMNITYTGIYGCFPVDEKAEVSVLKRDGLDKIFNARRAKSGVSEIDKALTFRTHKTFPLEQHFDTNDLSNFLILSESIAPIELLIKQNYLEYIGDLKGHNVIGIETNQWLYDHDMIALLINEGGKLIQNLVEKIR